MSLWPPLFTINIDIWCDSWKFSIWSLPHNQQRDNHAQLFLFLENCNKQWVILSFEKCSPGFCVKVRSPTLYVVFHYSSACQCFVYFLSFWVCLARIQKNTWISGQIINNLPLGCLNCLSTLNCMCQCAKITTPLLLALKTTPYPCQA